MIASTASSSVHAFSRRCHPPRSKDREIPRLRHDPRDWSVYAKKLIHAFGETVFDIIEAEPDRLREVTGIGPKRAEEIVAGWAEQRVIREIMIFLHTNGVGASRAVRIYKTYGNDAVQLISEDPYRLARDIRGIGFRTADAIAMKLGVEKTAMIRARAGISYALTESLDDGHCGLPRDELMPLAACRTGVFGAGWRRRGRFWRTTTSFAVGSAPVRG